ncbi:unnamed protein product [Ectocarpus sp. 12 AP-2014]
MSTEIIDLSQYGNIRGRDVFSRHMYQSVKGDGTTASSLTQSFYGIESSTDTEKSLATVNVSEGAADDAIGTYTVGVNDGSAVNNVLQLSNAASTITSSTVTLETPLVKTDGLIEAPKVFQSAIAGTKKAEVEIVGGDGTASPLINFNLGEDDGTSVPTVLSVSDASADVTGTLNVNGTDILQTIINGNAWHIDGSTVELKAEYPLVNVNVLNPLTSAVALDVNGSIVDRGNNFYMYDATGLSNLSTIAFDNASNSLALRTSLADQGGVSDSMVFQTTSGVNNTYLDRLKFDGGVGDQSATFSNVNVGIGASPSGDHRFEVTGTTKLTGNATVVGNVDVFGNDLLNVSDITSSDALAEQATIVLTSSATDPQIDFVLGDLDGTPTTAMTITESAATVNVATTVTDNLTVTGDFVVNGTTTTVNTAEVRVEDKEIDLAYNATAHVELDQGGITLGTDVTGIVVPSVLYSVADTRWDSSITMNVPSTNKFTVGGNVTELSSTGLDVNSDTGVIHLGAQKQWRIRMENDGVSDHLYFEHDDAGTQTTWQTKMDIMQ